MPETQPKVTKEDVLNARKARDEEIDDIIKETLTKEKPPEEPQEPKPLDKVKALEGEIAELEASEKIRELEEKKQFLLNKGRPEAKNSGEPAEKTAEKPKNPILEDW